MRNIPQSLKKTILFCFLCTVNIATSQGEKILRNKVSINNNWLYLENETSTIEELKKDTNIWETIDIPHTWNSEDTVDSEPGYRRNASWYKKNITVRLSKKERKIIYFEGANITTKLYINSKEVGSHIGGYLGFKFDITNFLKGGNNEILVRVDNSYDPEIIPSQKSDFFIYGGITRDVWLLTLPNTHIKSIKIKTPKVSNREASLKIETKITNLNSKNNLSIKAELLDPFKNKISEKIISINKNTETIQFKNISNPKLWDTENPNLYTVKLSLIENKKIKDVLNEKVGFRWFEFKENGPFYLNGKRLLLRGTHRHEEHAGVGAAMSNKQHYADMKLIRDMGANFVRLAHYPQDPEIYKACNELGLLVWDELPWCRGGLGNDAWKVNTKRMLKEMIEQNFNHPSIILWSLGNEIYWLPDFEDGDNRENINTFLTELNEYAHELDPSRKTAIRKYYEGADIVDVFSPSIWSGWYSGSYKSYQKAIDQYKATYPHFLHAEYGGSSHLGRHTENPITGEGKIQSDGWEEAIVQTDVANIAQIGDWSENYIVDLFDWHLRISENDTTFVGNIQWAFKDFGTPLRPKNAIPYMNQKGLVDRNGKPKDAFYVFKSYWSEDPFTYIESHTWTERQGPKGESREVSVYSNCPEVELFLNGVSLGTKLRNTKAFPALGLHWALEFKEGENILASIGKTKTGKEVKDEIKVNYRFTKNTQPVGLELSYKPLENGNYLITATAIDKNNLRCLDYEDTVYFQSLSGGKLLKNQGTPNGSDIIQMANGKASIELIPDKKAPVINVSVLNQDFKGSYLKISL